jgi:anti-sigma factor RsiW
VASCSQVNSFFQAHIDGELDESEERILEAHLKECSACRVEVAKLEESHLELVTSCSMHRLQRTLTSDVLAHLPEMDPALSCRSHPTDPGLSKRRRALKVPVLIAASAATVLLGLLGFALYSAEHPQQTGEVIGMIVHAPEKGALRRAPLAARFEPARLESTIVHGMELETLEAAELAVSLAGNSILKMNAQTHVAIQDSRNVFVYRGQAFFDVGRGRRHFYVNTPAGEVMVFGTSFAVNVSSDETTVTVLEGDVLVSTPAGRSAVSRGKQSTLRLNAVPTEPIAVDSARLLAWATAIRPDGLALAHAREAVNLIELPRGAIPAESVFAVRNLSEYEIDGVRISWEYDGLPGGHCGYFLHVTDADDNLLFLESIDGRVFDDPANTTLTLLPTKGPLMGIDVLHARLIPDYTGGARESDISVNVVAR